MSENKNNSDMEKKQPEQASNKERKSIKTVKDSLRKKNEEIENLKKEVATLKEANAKLQNALEEKHEQTLRIMADYENYRKRLLKETEDRVKFANNELIKDLLPVLDYLEMALQHTKDQSSFNALYEGVELTLKQFKDVLSKFGLKDLTVNMGEIFNPSFHEAMMLDYKNDEDNNVITRVMQKGYLLHDMLIRPAKVAVNKNEAQSSQKKENAESENKPH